MISALVVLAGGVLGVWLYCSVYGATLDLRNACLSAATGGLVALGALWFLGAIPVIVGSFANILMGILLFIAVATVCAVGILAARSGNDYRIRHNLRRERAHPRVSGHGPADGN